MRPLSNQEIINLTVGLILPGGGLFLCFCCVMLELGFVVVAREEQRGEQAREPSAKKQDVCRLLRLSVATGTNSSPRSMYRFGPFLG
jgi:hypothetical protein